MSSPHHNHRQRYGGTGGGETSPHSSSAPSPPPGGHHSAHQHHLGPAAQLHRPVSPFGHHHPLAASVHHQHHLARYPEVGLFNQLGSLFPKSSTAAASQPPGPSSSEPADVAGGPQGSSASAAATGSSQRGKQSASSYAVRHQAAEQRRRARINDRLDHLRTIVPHPERTNTAAFLEEAINHVVGLQNRVKELEQLLAEKQDKEPAAAGGDSKKRGNAGEKDRGDNKEREQGRPAKKPAR